MAVGCVFSCRHPLWGGDGICITDDGDSDPTVDAACSCGAGFSSRDGAGFPSCVPKLALVSGYTIFGISGLLTTGFLLLHANRYRYLAQQCRSTRRVAVRIRALVSGRWVRRTRESTHCPRTWHCSLYAHRVHPCDSWTCLRYCACRTYQYLVLQVQP